MSIHSINASSLKITADFFSFFSSFSFFEKVASRSQNLYRKEKELKNKTKQKTNQQLGEIILLNFQFQDLGRNQKSRQCGFSKRTDTQKPAESPEINLHKYQLTFDKDAKAIQWRKNHFFNKWCWNNLDIHIQKKKKNEP